MRRPTLLSDRDRFLISLGTALVLHAFLFLPLSFLDVPDRAPLNPPLFVALDPVPPLTDEDLSPEDPERVDPETAVEPEPEEVPPEEPPPVPPANEDAALASEEAASVDTSSSAEPAPAEPAEPTSSQPPPAEPAPAAPAGPTFVETPPPPPPPPRRRAFDDLRGDFSADATATAQDDPFVEEQIASLYDWQSRYRDQLEAWEERQAVRADHRADDDVAQDAARSAQAADNALADQLDRLIQGIRSSSANVIDARPGPAPSASREPTDGADGSGVAVSGTGGTRRRTAGESPQLDRVALGAGFPPEYPVRVVFTVDAAGRVTTVRITPPTPEPALNTAISEAVRTWRFQPAQAPDAGPVTGSVTIIVQTR